MQHKKNPFFVKFEIYVLPFCTVLVDNNDLDFFASQFCWQYCRNKIMYNGFDAISNRVHISL